MHACVHCIDPPYRVACWRGQRGSQYTRMSIVQCAITMIHWSIASETAPSSLPYKRRLQRSPHVLLRTSSIAHKASRACSYCLANRSGHRDNTELRAPNRISFTHTHMHIYVYTCIHKYKYVDIEKHSHLSHAP
jgi:hypothetical protein